MVNNNDHNNAYVLFPSCYLYLNNNSNKHMENYYLNNNTADHSDRLLLMNFQAVALR